MKNLVNRYVPILAAAVVFVAGSAAQAQMILSTQSGGNGPRVLQFAGGQTAQTGQSRVTMPVIGRAPAPQTVPQMPASMTVRTIVIPNFYQVHPQTALPYPYPWNSPYPMLPNPYTPQNSYYGPSAAAPQFLSGYDFPGYVCADYGNWDYPAVYGMYDGMPDYFDGSGSWITVSGPSNYVFDSGTWYPYGYDPFNQVDNSQAAQEALPQGLGSSLTDLAQAWKTGDIGAMDKHLSANQPIRVSFNGRYSYTLGANDYALMTRDAIQRLGTSDFRFTGVRVAPSGVSMAYAVQTYTATSGGPSKMYVAYTLRRDTSQSAAYTLVGVGTSTQPIAASSHPG